MVSGNAEDKAIAAVAQAMIDHPGDGLVRGVKTVSLFRIIPNEFFAEPMSAIITQAKMLTVAHEPGKWRLILKDQWEEEVVLDDSYNLLTATKIA